ncbi:hypothetical protein ACOBQJ_11285 [Pelotomaculum propionicicum]|uniref:hypothetical protein n=1 Tax=Pelotomaculum propionicicum TaxID=258475 RepID=UPI003B8106F1
MLEQIKEITDRIRVTREGLENLSDKVEHTERYILDEALKMAFEIIAFEPIASSASYHNCANCEHETHYTYSDKRGIRLASSGGNKLDPDGENIEEKELWYLDTGEFITTYRKGYKSSRENEWWSWSRQLLKNDVDPVEADYDVKEILRNLVSHLEERLGDLSSHIRMKQDRIDDLHRLDLH